MSEELKPCPCCGKSAIETMTCLIDSNSDYAVIECTGCGLSVPLWNDGEKNGIKLWNTRPETKPLTVEQIKQILLDNSLVINETEDGTMIRLKADTTAQDIYSALTNESELAHLRSLLISYQNANDEQCERIKELEANEDRLKQHLRDIAKIVGGHVSPECSLDFHFEVTGEVRLVIAKLQAQVSDMREALEQLARLGNEPHYGNSLGNTIALEVLAKYPEEK